MVFIFYLVINIGAIFAFFNLQKVRIHKIEVFVYWMLSSLIIQNYSAIQSMNYKSSVIPDNIGSEFSHLLNRTVLYPVLTVMFLNMYSQANSRVKMILIISYVVLLTAAEELSSHLGVFVHVSWKIWGSAIFWLLSLLALIWFRKYFGKKLIMEA